MRPTLFADDMDVTAVELAWAIVRPILPRRCSITDCKDGRIYDGEGDPDLICEGRGWLYPDPFDRPDGWWGPIIRWHQALEDVWRKMGILEETE